jgi:hypothetical protein
VDVNTLAFGLGESRAHLPVREDGTAETHVALRNLARDLVVRYRKHDLRLTIMEVDRAFDAWLSTCKLKGYRLRKDADTYRDELHESVRSTDKADFVDKMVDLWIRWTRKLDFPATGSSDERLEYAIRRHCADFDTREFFLSARDAATITGTTFRAANDTLHRLERKGVIRREGKRKYARHAQEFLLIRTCPLRQEAAESVPVTGNR